ncbi:MAG: AEC family transporter [Betaproteobacteria bacterium]|nr:AEC family transporter [Betaproteobacteria bacterium]MDE2208359.1 AEC family transporter [Betaproteobacteria bacterium]MDE2360463.1 AEC family transporter [Betaproteobacteria bacterium]
MLLHLVALTAPLFLLVLLGYVLTRFGWPRSASDALTRFVFTVAVPTLLFRLMSDFSRLPRVDPRLLIAFFGGCLVVYAIGRVLGASVFRMDGAAQSVFAMGGIFSNNVLLGIPLAKVTLGEASLPAVSLVLVFNSLTLWTLVTVSVEWAKHRDLSFSAIARTGRGVLRNPIVASILAGTGFGFLDWPLPTVIDQTLQMVSQAAVPLSLIALGMGLAEFGVRAGWRESAAITVLKLLAQPLAVYALARMIALPPLETSAVVMLAALPVGANVYLMARQFDVLGSAVASSIVVTTALAAVTTPIALTLIGAVPG